MYKTMLRCRPSWLCSLRFLWIGHRFTVASRRRSVPGLWKDLSPSVVSLLLIWSSWCWWSCVLSCRLKKKRQPKQSQSEKADAEQSQSDVGSKTLVISEPAPIGRSQERKAGTEQPEETRRGQNDRPGKHSDVTSNPNIILDFLLLKN